MSRITCRRIALLLPLVLTCGIAIIPSIGRSAPKLGANARANQNPRAWVSYHYPGMVQGARRLFRAVKGR